MTVRSFVFAVGFRIAESDRIRSVLHRHQSSLVALGARYAFVYESIVERGSVLVIIGMRTDQPLLSLLRSEYFFEWFDAVGVEDLPAMFAGETVERLDIGESPTPGTEVVVAAVSPVEDVDGFVARVRESVSEFAKSDIRKTLVYRAFDTPHEVMFVQQLVSAERALTWINRSDIASAWLTAAGIGVYPPVFVGQFVTAMRVDEATGVSWR